MNTPKAVGKGNTGVDPLTTTGMHRPSEPRHHIDEKSFVNKLFERKVDDITLNDLTPVFDGLVTLSLQSDWQTSTHEEKLDSKPKFNFLNMMFILLLPRLRQHSRSLPVLCLKKLNAVVNESILLKAYCTKQQWVYHLLGIIAHISSPEQDICDVDSYAIIMDEMVTLIEVLITFSASQRDVKALAVMTNHVYAKHARPKWWPYIVKILGEAFRKRDGPDCFFYFFGNARSPGGAGTSSGLMVPMGGRHHLISSGYTFTTWIYLEPLKRMEEQMCVYSFINDAGEGFECLIQGNCLVFQVRLAKKKMVSQRAKFCFTTRKWYFIAISHVYHHFWTSELTLSVDNTFTDSIALQFPKISQNLTQCHIGNSHSLNQSFAGCMGPVMMFQTALSAPEVDAIYRLGPNCVPVIDASNTEVLTGPDGAEFVFEGKKTARLLFQYNPRAVDKRGVMCLETASCDPAFTATAIQEGVCSIVRQSTRSQLEKIGGLEVILYPLFYQLGMPIDGIEATKCDPTMDETNENISRYDPYHVIKVMHSLLDENATAQSWFEMFEGLAVISALLQSRYPSHDHWTLASVRMLERVLDSVKKNDKLWHQAFAHLFLANFSLWCRTPFVVQAHLLLTIASRVSTSPAHFRDVFGVGQFIDILRNYYYVDTQPGSQYVPGDTARKDFVPIWEGRLDVSEVKQLRVHVMHIIRELIKPNIMDYEEARIIAQYIRDCSPVEFEDVAQFLLEMLPPLHDTEVMELNISPRFSTTPGFFSRSDSLHVHYLPAHLAYLWDLSTQTEVERRRDATWRSKIAWKNACTLWRNFSRMRECILDGLIDIPRGNAIMPLIPEQELRIYFKLDRMEGPSRMRSKLKRNFEGSSYETSTRAQRAPSMSPLSMSAPGDHETIESCWGLGTGLHHILEDLVVTKDDERKLDTFIDEFIDISEPESMAKASSRAPLARSQSTSSIGSITYTALPSSSTPPASSRPALADSGSSAPRPPPPMPGKPPTFSPSIFRLPESEKINYTTSTSQMILFTLTCSGVFTVTSTHIHFVPHSFNYDNLINTNADTGAATSSTAPTGSQQKTDAEDNRILLKKDHYSWPLKDLTDIYRRRYLMRWNALELFFNTKVSRFFVFMSPDECKVVYTKLTALHPPNLVGKYWDPPAKLFKKSRLMERWRRREISNFEYLMGINTISGRTYNDVSQYPVFPHVLSDFTSETLDLNNPASYRDLSRPVGALNASRLAQLLARFHESKSTDMNIPPFLYGSHYSNFGIVLYYLLRLEPFARLFLSLQSGSWDHPSRMFSSVAGMYDGVAGNNPADVKELIPEFFYMPEFLVNSSKFEFGFPGNQSGNVVLPPWACNSPEKFITLHREALESEHVSANLHRWIDLIFGVRQRGLEAESANNVFFHLTYEGAVDLDKETDPVQLRSYQSQLLNFGQTPPQLLTRPHPARLTLDELAQPSSAKQLVFNTFSSLLPDKFTQSIMAITRSPSAIGVSLPSTRDLLPDPSASPSFKSIAESDEFSSPSKRRPSSPTPLGTPALTASHSEYSKIYTYRLSKERATLPLVYVACSGAGIANTDTVILLYKNGVLAANKFITTSTPSSTIFSSASLVSITQSQSEEDIPAASASEAESNSNGLSNSDGGGLPRPRSAQIARSNSGGSAENWTNISTLPFTLEIDKTLGTPKEKHLQLDLLDSVNIKCISNCFALTSDGKMLLSCGGWDSLFKCSLLSTGKVHRTYRFGHHSPVTCLCLSSDNAYFATGSQDASILVYNDISSLIRTPSTAPIHRLCYHHAPVTCLDICIEWDVLVSGSMDGHLIVYALRKGRYVQRIRHPGPVEMVKISNHQQIIVCSCAHSIYVYSLNGKLLNTVFLGQESLSDMKVTSSPSAGRLGEQYLVTGGSSGVKVWTLPDLEMVHGFSSPTPVRTLSLSTNEKFLLVGLEDGLLVIVPFNESIWNLE